MSTTAVPAIDSISPFVASASRPVLFTIGYEGLTVVEYVSRLLQNEIAVVIDVRRNPISRKKGFSKTALFEALRSHSIEYFHLPGLGIESSLRKALVSSEDYLQLFAYYETTLLPTAADELNRIAFYMKRFGSVALTCFERDYHMCHRHCVADAIYKKGLISDRAVNI